VGSQWRGRPRIGWLNNACNDMKVMNLKIWKELAKPAKGCKSNGRRRRRRRRRRLYILLKLHL
jgi:hypothetical protein